MTGLTIKRLRETAGLTQAKLADELHVNVSTIKRWEQGVLTPSEDSIKRLNRYFKVDVTKYKPSQTVNDSVRCRKCEYRYGWKETGMMCCDYFGRTGKLRGCPAGDNCTKYKPRSTKRRFGQNYKI